MTQLAQNKESRSFLIEFFRAFFRPSVHFRTPAFRSPLARANRTQSTHSVTQTGAPIRPYATESQSLTTIQSNKILIGTQKHSRRTLTCTNHTTSHFLIGTKNGLFALAVNPENDSLNFQDDFAELGAVFQAAVGGGGFGERENFVEDGMEFFAGDEVEDREKFGFAAHVRAEKRQLAAEKEAQIDFRVVAGGGAAGDEASVDGERGDALRPGSFADVFEDDVDAALVGDAFHFGVDLLASVDDDFVGAEGASFFGFLVAADGGDDARAEDFCDLDSGGADAAASAEDENVFAGLKFGACDEHVPCGDENERNSGGFFERKSGGHGSDVARGRADVFGVASVDEIAEERVVAAEIVVAGEAGDAASAADAWLEENFFADANAGDEFAGGGDFAGDVAAPYVTNVVRHGNLNAGDAFADPKIEMIQRAGADADEDFVGARRRIGHVRVGEDFRAAVLREDDCFHSGVSVESEAGVYRKGVVDG